MSERTSYRWVYQARMARMNGKNRRARYRKPSHALAAEPLSTLSVMMARKTHDTSMRPAPVRNAVMTERMRETGLARPMFIEGTVGVPNANAADPPPIDCRLAARSGEN